MTYSFKQSGRLVLVPMAALLVGLACSVSPSVVGGDQSCDDSTSEAQRIAEPLTAGLATPLARVPASAAFKKRWWDGKAELSGYKVTTMRYGEARAASVVLIYVTENMDRRSWIKDDRGDVPAKHKVPVLKLNRMLKFNTGIYPYSVMTSVFSPLDGQGRERFAPAKISLGSQEWCGHVHHAVHPKGARYHSRIQSYFSSEGDRAETVTTAAGTLYEDALLIQLRELDGPFNGGKDWSGQLVPTLWSVRKAHQPLRPVAATIRRSVGSRDGTPVTRFVVKRGSLTTTLDVEQAAPRRILGWRGSDGEQAALLKTTRLAYWKLNKPGGEVYLKQLGL